jgi:hypothetical protein
LKLFAARLWSVPTSLLFVGLKPGAKLHCLLICGASAAHDGDERSCPDITAISFVELFACDCCD